MTLAATGALRADSPMMALLRQLETALADAGLTRISRLLDEYMPNWRGRGEAMAQRLAASAATPFKRIS